VTEKNGGLNRVRVADGRIEPITGLPADIDRRLETPIDNTGIFDVAIGRDFDRDGRVFIAFASEGPGGSALAVSSFQVSGDRLTDEKRLLLAGPRSRDRIREAARQPHHCPRPG
jgi:hypothetical protein